MKTTERWAFLTRIAVAVATFPIATLSAALLSVAPNDAFAEMSDTTNPAAPDHLPIFITAPGQSDVLYTVMVVVLLVAILMIGILYFRLHALPEHIAHRTTKIQYEIVAVLGLLSLFTHNHVYWVAGLLLALVQLPDFTTPLTAIADSLAKIAGSEQRSPDVESMSSRPSGPTQQVAGESKDLSHV